VTISERYYFDTSVFGGVFDDEFAEPTRRLFARVRRGEITCMYSDLTKDELKGAPGRVNDHFKSLPEKYVEFVKAPPDAYVLARQYLDAKVVGKTSEGDCLHIAIATIYKANLLVSWNFKHIVNITRIHGYNAVNLLHGHIQLDIRSPREIIES
jgi:hypothetical protein